MVAKINRLELFVDDGGEGEDNADEALLQTHRLKQPCSLIIWL